MPAGSDAPRPGLARRVGLAVWSRRGGATLAVACLLALLGIASPVDGEWGLGTVHASQWATSRGHFKWLLLGCATAMFIASTAPLVATTLMLAGRAAAGWTAAGLGLAASVGHVVGHGVDRGNLAPWQGTAHGIWMLALANAVVLGTAVWRSSLRERVPWRLRSAATLGGTLVAAVLGMLWLVPDPITPALVFFAGPVTAWQLPGCCAAAEGLTALAKRHGGQDEDAAERVADAVCKAFPEGAAAGNVLWYLGYIGDCTVSDSTGWTWYVPPQAHRCCVAAGLDPMRLLDDPWPRGVFAVVRIMEDPETRPADPEKRAALMERMLTHPVWEVRAWAHEFTSREPRLAFGDDLDRIISVLGQWPTELDLDRRGLRGYPREALIPHLRSQSRSVRMVVFYSLIARAPAEAWEHGPPRSILEVQDIWDPYPWPLSDGAAAGRLLAWFRRHVPE